MNVLITLTEELLKLVTACHEAEVPIMIGGGLGLYLRDWNCPVFLDSNLLV